MQAHFGITGEFVEGGQVCLISILVSETETETETYAMLIADLGLVEAVAKRRKQK